LIIHIVDGKAETIIDIPEFVWWRSCNRNKKAILEVIMMGEQITFPLMPLMGRV
jgi:hypothetical protein